MYFDYDCFSAACRDIIFANHWYCAQWDILGTLWECSGIGSVGETTTGFCHFLYINHRFRGNIAFYLWRGKRFYGDKNRCNRRCGSGIAYPSIDRSLKK